MLGHDVVMVLVGRCFFVGRGVVGGGLLQSQEGHLLQAQEALRSGSNHHFKMENQVFEVYMYTSIISYGLNKGYIFQSSIQGQISSDFQGLCLI